jgi:hypothetical protein
MDYKQWIKKEIETGKTWEDLKNISEEEFLELRDDMAIIPEDIEYSSWRAIVSDREKSYVGFAKKTGISSSDSLEFQIPDSKFSCWRQYKASLASKMKDTAIEDVEQSSHWLLNQLAYKSGIKKGLVMGSVQSGKTANMVGLVSMAADYDWNFFVVLSGTIDNLRIQTRDRFKKDLKNTDSVQWHVLDYGCDKDHLYDYSSNKDITSDDLMLNAVGNRGYAHKYIMVCLKQSGRLEKLINWLHQNQSKAKKIRMIVIDDEADQASINTKLMENAVDEEPEDDVERTKINNSIVNLVSNRLPNDEISNNPLQSITYVSYTATPYANILNERIEGYSLYPRDFIFSLPEPKAYFGEKVIFGSYSDKEHYPGLDIIRNIPDDEMKVLSKIKDKAISLPEELKNSLKWFFCAAAVRRINNKKQPISMLIHTSPRVKVHLVEYKMVSDWLCSVDPEEFTDSCRTLYNAEIARFTKESFKKGYSDYDFIDSIPDALPAFDEIESDIKCLLTNITNISLDDEEEFEYTEDGVHLCVDNCYAQRYADHDTYMRIVYPDEKQLSEMSKSPVFIIFGGNTLSRGLTLEGLTCTYFARNVTQADTLMQMARWFGYRKGYELLQRIWLSSQSLEHFKLLQKIDEELKKEFDDFVKEKKDPNEFGPKVLNFDSLKKLKLTAKNKMQGAVVSGGSYDGDAFETTRFRDNNSLAKNFKSLTDLISNIGFAPTWACQSTSSIVWRTVNSGPIMKFFDSYVHYDDKQERILKVLRKAKEEEKYLNWNVVLVGGEVKKMWAPYGGYEIPKSMRSKKIDEPDVDIARLRNSTDALLDVDYTKLNDEQKQIFDAAKAHLLPINASRGKLGLADTPLLLIYLIDKDAEKKKNDTRESIKTNADVVAYSIIISGDGKDEDGPTTLSIRG